MTAIVIRETGEPADVLATEEPPRTPPRAGEVRVLMLAAPVNPSDLMFIRGEYGKTPDCPQSPGFEGVGVVEESGGGVVGSFFKGKRVAVFPPNGGTWSGSVTLSAKRLGPVPASLPVEQAATFFVNPATAWVMTREVLAVPKGEWLLQTAGGSALGRMVTKLGKREGFRVLSVVRREEQVRQIQDLGGEAVLFDAESDDPETLAKTVRAKCGDVRHAIDPVGGKLTEAVLDTLSDDARLLVYGSLSPDPVRVSPRKLLTSGKRVEGFWLGPWMERQSLLKKAALMRRLGKFVGDGTLATEGHRNFAPTDWKAALSAAEETRSGEKVLFRFGASPAN